MCDEKLVRKYKRLIKKEKQKKPKNSATLAQQQALMNVNKRYRQGTKIKVTVNL
jgi:hypothetical protein